MLQKLNLKQPENGIARSIAEAREVARIKPLDAEARFVVAQLMLQITRYAPESVFPTIAGWPHQSIKDHRRVVAALAKHDSELARKAMSDHLAAGAAPLIDHLAQNGVVDGADCSPRRRPRHQPRS